MQNLILKNIPVEPKSITYKTLSKVLHLTKKKHLTKLHYQLSILIKNNVVIQSSSGALSRKEKSSPTNKKIPKSTRTIPKPSDDFTATCEEFSIPLCFPKNIIDETNQIDTDLLKEKSLRKNYSKDFVFTIDSQDAKDLDDAISIQNLDSHFLLTVHIADVSFFVPENSPLDLEALERGNSTYLINKVVPMLPFKLSADMCSLNTQSEKLTLSVQMTIDLSGNITHYDFHPSIIQSKMRLNYDEVQVVLDSQQTSHPAYPHLKTLETLTHILYKKRIKMGSLDFTLPETKIECDPSGRPISFSKKERLFSHRMIEESMLAANSCAGEFLSKHKTGLFRVHDKPVEEKLQYFQKSMKNMGISHSKINNAFDIQRFIKKTEDSPISPLIQQLLVQSMSQAHYSPSNIGHFGLAIPLYAHFTSPIRRYSDLIVHRQIKNILIRNKSLEVFDQAHLNKIAKHISTTERISIKAERFMVKRKSMHFLEKTLKNTVVEAQIVAIIPRGIFISLTDSNIEGFIPKTHLKHFKIMADNQVVITPKFIQLKLGSLLQVRFFKCSWSKYFIDFNLVTC